MSRPTANKSAGSNTSLLWWALIAQQRLQPIVNAVKDKSLWAYQSGMTVLKRYPPLQAFLLSLLVLSAVPLAIFAGVGATSGAFVLGTAGSIVTVIQGSILAISGFILFWVLIGALFLAGCITFWFSAAYFSVKVAKRVKS